MIPTAKDYCEKRHNESPNTLSWIDFNVIVMNEYAKRCVLRSKKQNDY